MGCPTITENTVFKFTLFFCKKCRVFGQFLNSNHSIPASCSITFIRQDGLLRTRILFLRHSCSSSYEDCRYRFFGLLRAFRNGRYWAKFPERHSSKHSFQQLVWSCNWNWNQCSVTVCFLNDFDGIFFVENFWFCIYMLKFCYYRI